MAEAQDHQPTLGTRQGKAVLALLLAIGFLDFVDASIVNVALPSIRTDLGFSIGNLQWVLSGYLLTYGGFMLLGGRARTSSAGGGSSSSRDRALPGQFDGGGAGTERRDPRRLAARARGRRCAHAPSRTVHPDNDV